MNKTLKSKMILWIWGSTALLFLITSTLYYHYSRTQEIRDVTDKAHLLAKFYAQKFDNKFLQAEEMPRMMTVDLETRNFKSEKELKYYLKSVLLINPQAYGSCIAYEPYAFSLDKYYFAPYYYYNGKTPKFVQLGNKEYNYFNWEWYSVPKERLAPYWTEPYMDTGGGESMMITYSTPFYKNKKFRGIITVDITIDDLNTAVKAIKATKSGYAFLLSRKGQFLSFPDKRKILKETIFNYNEKLGNIILGSKECSMVEGDDPLLGKDCWVVFCPITSADIYFVVVYPKSEVMESVLSLEKRIYLISLVGFICLFILIAFISDSISRPVRQIADATKRLSTGNLEQKIEVFSNTSEIIYLTGAFNKMIDDLKHYIEVIKVTTAEKERMAGELKVASQIQQSILPQITSEFSLRKDFEIYAKMLPAREVGGDFYDFFYLDNDRLGIVIGDVSGKGVPAAIFMAVARTMLRVNALKGEPSDKCLYYVNNLICAENESMMFVTIFYGILNLKTGIFEYCNAGHNPPYIIKNNKEVLPLKLTFDMAIGIKENIEYHIEKILFDPGDFVFLYTDGITEAQDSGDNLFLNSRLESNLENNSSLSPQNITDKILEIISNFSSGVPQSDDITILVLKRAKGVVSCQRRDNLYKEEQ